MSEIQKRLNKIIEKLGEKQPPITLTFIMDTDKNYYRLSDTDTKYYNLTLNDNEFKTEQDIRLFTKRQADLIGVAKITPVIIKVVDNSYLEVAMYG